MLTDIFFNKMVQHHIAPMHVFHLWLKSSRKGSAAEGQNEYGLHNAHSPDLSPLDFWLWGKLQQIVYDKKPATIEGLWRIVNNAARSISDEI